MSTEETIHHGPIRLNCPHCHNPIEIVAENPDQEVLCPSCGSSFHLDADRTQTWSKDRLPTLGKFQLIEAVGRGAFGTVYRALDTQLQRIVAVKVPRSGQLATNDDEDRFVREARNAAQLQHAGIVPVFEVGRSETFPYIVSEFVEGVTLADTLTARKFSFREAADLVAKVAEALHHAHDHGVVHRDLKPSNIMLTSDGTPRVMDFGLAKRDAGEITMTVEGQVLGTPAYMSPEQASGQGHHVDGRSDVYSVGVLLFELLTGELPFRGNQRMLLHQVLHDEPRSPRSLNDRIPRDLETICLKAMAKEAGRRYQSALELAIDLTRYLAGEPITARPVGHVERSWRWCRRNPLVAGLFATVATALILGIGISSYFAIQANMFASEANARSRDAVAERERANASAEKEKEARAAADVNAAQAEINAQTAIKEKRRADATLENERLARADAEASAERARQEKEQASRLRYRGDMHGAQRAWEDAQINIVSQLLARHQPKDGEQDLRGFEWYYQQRLLHSDLRTLEGHARSVLGVAFSPDGRRLASASDDRTIKLWDAETGAELVTLKGHTSVVHTVSFSPDGRRLASASFDGEAIKLWDAETGDELRTLKGHSNSVRSVAFSPDGRRLASSGDDRTIKLWDAETGVELRTLKGHGYRVFSVCFSPDGRRLASGGEGDHRIKLWDSESGTELRTLKGHTSLVWSVAFSPDGQQLASAAGGVIKLWDAESGVELRTLKGHNNGVQTVCFSPDGERLVSGGADGTIKLWDAKTGGELRTIRGHAGAVGSVCFSPDGRRLASGSSDRTVKLWDTETEIDCRTLKGRVSDFQRVSFSPGGQHFVTNDGETIKLWDAESGVELRTLKGHNNGVQTVCFSPDGERLVSGGADGTIKLWDAKTGGEMRTIRSHAGYVASVCFSPDGRRLASGSSDRTIKLWDAETGNELRTLNGHTNLVMCVSFSPDGRRLASAGGDGNVKLWDIETGANLRTLGIGSRSNVCFSPNGRQLATCGGGEIELWDSETAAEIRAFKGHSHNVTDVAFSPDGRRMASSSGDQTIKIWDVETGEELRTLMGHTSSVNSVSFSLDGRRLASAGDDRTIRLWDTLMATPDEKMAQSLVNGYFDELVFSEDVIAVVERAPGWSKPMRQAALSYAQSVARHPQRINASAWKWAMLGNWEKAAQLHVRTVELSNRSWETLWTLGLLQAAAGDYAGYRATCAELLTHRSESGRLSQDMVIVWNYAIGDHASEDLEPVVALAKQPVGTREGSAMSGSMLGAIQFRAGQTKEAIATLNKALPGYFFLAIAAPQNLDQIEFSRLIGEITLALAYHREGDKHAFDKQRGVVTSLIANMEKSPPKSNKMPPWHIPFAIEMAKRELAGLQALAAENK